MKTATSFPTQRGLSRRRRHRLLRLTTPRPAVNRSPRRLKPKHVLAYGPGFLRVVVLLADGLSVREAAEHFRCHKMDVVRVCYWLGLFFGPYVDAMRTGQQWTLEAVREYLTARCETKLGIT